MPISERPQPLAAEMMIESPDKAAVEGHAFSYICLEEAKKKLKKALKICSVARDRAPFLKRPTEIRNFGRLRVNTIDGLERDNVLKSPANILTVHRETNEKSFGETLNDAML